MAAAGGDPQATRRLRRLGETCLWLIVIAVAVLGLVELLSRLRVAVLAVGLAVVLATILRPLVRRLSDRGWPDGVAAITVLTVALALLGGAMALVVPPAVDRIGALDTSVSGGLEEIEAWLADGPLPLNDDQAASLVNEVQEAATANLETLARSAVGGAVVTLEVLASLVLAIVLLFFFLKDAERLWGWLVALAPPRHRSTVDEGGQRAWSALGGFVRGQTLVALFDATFIGLALLVLGVPLVLPLAVLTFFGAYVPILGATIAGSAAALVALVAEGPTTALGVVIAVVVVQQVEGNVFQPVVVGRAISVHPVAVLLGITVGGVLGGILGALVATPIVAVGAALLEFVRERSGNGGGREERFDPDGRAAGRAAERPAS